MHASVTLHSCLRHCLRFARVPLVLSRSRVRATRSVLILAHGWIIYIVTRSAGAYCLELRSIAIALHVVSSEVDFLPLGCSYAWHCRGVSLLRQSFLPYHTQGLAPGLHLRSSVMVRYSSSIGEIFEFYRCPGACFLVPAADRGAPV